MAMTDAQKRAMAIAKAKQRAAEAGSQTAFSGSILPFSRDASGDVHFDSNAGLLGSMKRAVSLPHDVMTGEVDPLSNEGIGRAAEMATVASPVNPAIRAGEAAVPGVLNAVRRDVKPPSSEALRTAAGEGYDTARGMGVDFSANAVKDLATKTQAALENDGILAELAPKSFTILTKLRQPPKGAVAPLSGIEAARRALGNAAKDFNNPTEQLAAKRISDELDRFLEQPDAASVVAGPAADAAGVLKRARANYGAAKRSDRVTGVQDAAELRGKVANSGLNTGNTIRQRIATLILNPKTAAGYSPEELKLLRGVSEGSPAANTTRYVGNLMGGGGGLGAGVSGGLASVPGMAAGNPALAALGAVGVPLAGYANKKASQILTERALRLADEAIRKRSPLYEAMLAETEGKVLSPERRAALVRELLIQQQNMQAQQ